MTARAVALRFACLAGGLIVVGSCGMHGVKRVLGSVPNKVAHRARCNVMIVATEGAG